MNRYVTIGLSVLAGAALLEAALVPGVVIGGAAVLAPRYLPKLRRRLKPLFLPAPQQRAASAAASSSGSGPGGSRAIPGFDIKRALAKTITFRVIVTGIDFTVNYVVIGEVATAAGLSAASLVVGPIFYLAHETAWNRFGPRADRMDLAALRPWSQRTALPIEFRRIAVSRAIAKTVTFRMIASTVDFTVNYVVVGDLATALALSAFGIFVGPLIYFGHEQAWERLAPSGKARGDRPLHGHAVPPAGRPHTLPLPGSVEIAVLSTD